MPTTALTPPTERQVAFVNELAAEVTRLSQHNDDNLAAAWQEVIRVNDGAARSRQIDAMISIRDRYRRAARTPRFAIPVATGRIPVGHYAVDGPILGVSGQPIVFFRVTVSYGRLWVNQVVGGYHDRAMGVARAEQVVTLIERAGIQNAARRYGQSIGRCYVCNTRLTDAESRRLGIGPDCRGGRSARGNAFSAWVAGDHSTVPAAVQAAARPVVLGPESGDCTICGEPALGYDRNDACYCDECAIDKDIPIRLFPRNPRLVTA